MSVCVRYFFFFFSASKARIIYNNQSNTLRYYSNDLQRHHVSLFIYMVLYFVSVFAPEWVKKTTTPTITYKSTMNEYF